MDLVIFNCLEKLPWVEALADKNAHAAKLVKGGCAAFNKHQTSLMHIMSKLEGKEESHKGLLELFENNSEIALAILLQNCMHPKNSQRVEAIKGDTYKEIDSPFAARAYIKETFKKNLEYELLAAESQINEQIAKLSQMHDVKVLMEAPDVFIAAAALSTKKFCQGKGDRTAFFNMILESDPASIPDVGRKLILVTQDKFMGLTLYSDALANCSRVNRKMIFKLWLHLCRKNEVVDLKKMIKFQPHAEEWLIAYDKFVDAEGRTTLNQEEHMKYRTECKDKASTSKKLKAAEISKKKHM